MSVPVSPRPIAGSELHKLQSRFSYFVVFAGLYRKFFSAVEMFSWISEFILFYTSLFDVGYFIFGVFLASFEFGVLCTSRL